MTRTRTDVLDRLDDERLARLSGADRAGAFATLYARHHQALYRYCATIVRDEVDAQDALQATWLRALQALRRGQRDAPVRPWLFRIAHNESISILRRRARGREQVLAAAPAQGSAEEGALARERFAQLLDDLRALPERARSALVLRELTGLSHEEIAGALHITVAAARQSIYEARRGLQDEAQGRAMACDEVQLRIGDGDRRVLRGRVVRAHIRHCPDCASFALAIGERHEALRAFAPTLGAAASGAILARVLGTAGGGAGGGAALGGSAGAMATGAASAGGTSAGGASTGVAAGGAGTATVLGGATGAATKALGAGLLAKSLAAAAVAATAAGITVAVSTNPPHAPHRPRGPAPSAAPVMPSTIAAVTRPTAHQGVVGNVLRPGAERPSPHRHRRSAAAQRRQLARGSSTTAHPSHGSSAGLDHRSHGSSTVAHASRGTSTAVHASHGDSPAGPGRSAVAHVVHGHRADGHVAVAHAGHAHAGHAHAGHAHAGHGHAAVAHAGHAVHGRSAAARAGQATSSHAAAHAGPPGGGARGHATHHGSPSSAHAAR